MNVEKHARQPVTSLPRRLGMNRFAILVVTVVTLFVSSMAAGGHVLHASDQEVSGRRPRRVRVAWLNVPRSVAAGEAVELRLSLAADRKLDDAELISKQGDALVTLDVVARQPGRLPVAEIRRHNGVPTLFVNGRPNAGMTYMTYDREATKHFASFGKIGVNLASFSATSDLSFFNLAPPTWLAPDKFDYSAFDKRIAEVLEANPSAYVFPRVYMSAPEWWSEANPDELVRQHDGSVWNPARPVGSWASEKWRADAGMALRRFIRHVRTSPYADRVLGYHMACGYTEEWFWWGFWEGDFLDYSEPNRRRFGQWLRRKYAGSDLGDVSIPTKQQRTTADLGFLRLPDKSRRLIDFNAYHNDLVADTIEHFARIVKEEVGGTQLCGVFYGYIFELNASPEGGHNALARLLRSEDVDFLTAPSSYAFRPVGSGYSTFMSTTESIKLHGKLWFDENDYRTHRVKDGRNLGTTNLPDTIQVQRRELANVLCHGTGMWWFDMGGGWYDEPEVMTAIGQMNRIAERSAAFDRSSVAEVALVIDAESTYYTLDRPIMGNLAVNRQRLGLGHMGAPFDAILLDDLEQARPYKLYVFANAYHLSPEDRRTIERRVKAEGRTALWVYTAGAVDPEGTEPVTGIRLTHDRTAAPLQVAITNTGDPITHRLKAGASWGAAEAVAPVFYCDDPSATVLGSLKGVGKAGLAVRRFEEWTSVWCAAPDMPSWLLREIARDAGVHIYSEHDEALYANRSFIGIHSHGAGPRRLRFPQAVDLYDVFGDKQAARQVREFGVELPASTTAFYFLGTAEQWQRAE